MRVLPQKHPPSGMLGYDWLGLGERFLVGRKCFKDAGTRVLVDDLDGCDKVVPATKALYTLTHRPSIASPWSSNSSAGLRGYKRYLTNNSSEVCLSSASLCGGSEVDHDSGSPAHTSDISSIISLTMSSRALRALAALAELSLRFSGIRSGNRGVWIFTDCIHQTMHV